MKSFTDHAREYCPNIFDDPEAGRDWCSLHDCHCVAIDSPYSHAERGESICKVFNTFPSINTHGKKCTSCHRSFIPSSNRQRYCPTCAKTARREKARKRKQMSRFRPSELVEIQGFEEAENMVEIG